MKGQEIHEFGSRLRSKSFGHMLQLKSNIEKGLNCAVATQNPEKTKQDFEYATGMKLILTAKDDSKGMFVASLGTSTNK